MKVSLPDSEQSIHRLFDEYFHLLVLSATRYVNDYERAEDIVQDVFVKLWQNVDDLQQLGDVKAYLFKAVKNSCLNYIRHAQVMQKHVDSFEERFEKSAEDGQIAEEITTRIYTAVSKLPSTWQEAFVLSRFDDLKYHEIASKMNISQKTVEKYISKSLQFLRTELKDLLLVSVIFFGTIFLK